MARADYMVCQAIAFLSGFFVKLNIILVPVSILSYKSQEPV